LFRLTTQSGVAGQHWTVARFGVAALYEPTSGAPPRYSAMALNQRSRDPSARRH
jgi:hypothetical protein